MKKQKRKDPLLVTGIAVSYLLALLVMALLACIACDTGMSEIMEALWSREVLFSLHLSFVTSCVSTALCIVAAVPAAYALARRSFFGKMAVCALIDLPVALPPLVAGIGLLMLFGRSGMGTLLSGIGIEVVFTRTGIVVAQFFCNFPYAVRIIRSAFGSVNERYELVAMTMGCTRFEAFVRTTLPMCRKNILSAILLTWSRGMGAFGAVLMLAGAVRMKTETLPLAVYLNMSCGEIGPALASSLILIAVSVVTLLFFERMSGDFIG